jgi:septal ring factor EnvC (AmiA/AmiB activator)
MLLAALVLLSAPLAAKDPPPGVDPVVLEQVQLMREEWTKDLDLYKEKIHKALDELRESLKMLREKITEEESKEKREALLKEYEETDRLREKLDSDEDEIQAARIVLWANRKERLEELLRIG